MAISSSAKISLKPITCWEGEGNTCHQHTDNHNGGENNPQKPTNKHYTSYIYPEEEVVFEGPCIMTVILQASVMDYQTILERREKEQQRRGMSVHEVCTNLCTSIIHVHVCIYLYNVRCVVMYSTQKSKGNATQDKCYMYQEQWVLLHLLIRLSCIALPL